MTSWRPLTWPASCTGLIPRTDSGSLPPLLDPKAVALYRQLEEAEKGDYELFKRALLREFGLTPEMYRERFRSQDKTPEISYLQLAVRMERYASKWADGAQTKEDLIKLLVLEQLYERCPSDLRLWLVDRKPENPRHAGQLADEFVKSRSGGGREEPQRNRPAAMQRESHPGTSQRGNMGNPLPRGMPSVRDNRPARGDPRDMSCYYCGRRGHVRAQCPKLKDRLSRPNPHWVNLVEAQTDEGQASHARGAGSLSTAQEREGPQASSSRGWMLQTQSFLVYTVGAGLSLRRVPCSPGGGWEEGQWILGYGRRGDAGPARGGGPRSGGAQHLPDPDGGGRNTSQSARGKGTPEVGGQGGLK
ncbi:uncharacterized protein LOC135979410 [Chrysemys picta bellii]|uniref:uncharacterized protein LOC135979410 n=1 Tax=Chrysemys picta bellii TaxID=8478 RepID=UPI0032B1F11C